MIFLLPTERRLVKQISPNGSGKLPSATTKPVTVTFLVLNTPADMGNALNTALTIGYRGTVSAYMDNANAVWHIELNGPGNPLRVEAGLTDVLIWDGTRLESLSQTVFSSKYTVI